MEKKKTLIERSANERAKQEGMGGTTTLSTDEESNS